MNSQNNSDKFKEYFQYIYVMAACEISKSSKLIP